MNPEEADAAIEAWHQCVREGTEYARLSGPEGTLFPACIDLLHLRKLRFRLVYIVRLLSLGIDGTRLRQQRYELPTKLPTMVNPWPGVHAMGSTVSLVPPYCPSEIL
jgi:plasmid stabilization system protein ParE